MIKKAEYAEVIKLRKNGLSFSQIKDQVNVSKDTLSRWLKGLPLTRAQLQNIKNQRYLRIEKYVKTTREKRERRFELLRNDLSEKIPTMTKREQLIAGLFLYWGEGNKRINGPISISNTNPVIIKFFMNWLKTCYNVPNEKFNALVHIYSDMDQINVIRYWSTFLHLPEDKFWNSYVKKSGSNSVNHSNEFAYGTCNLSVSDVRLKEIIMTSIKVISERYV